MTKTHRPRPRALSFALHYLQMVIAMAAGMMVLYPLWQLAVGGAPESAWVHRADVDSLVMATTMVIPMAAWMRFRSQDRKSTRQNSSHPQQSRMPSSA